MGELDDAWKNVTSAFKSLGKQLKSQYQLAAAEGRPLDEIEAEQTGRREVAEAAWDTNTDRPSAADRAAAEGEVEGASDAAAELREDLQEAEALEEGREEISETLAPLGESVDRDDVASAFDRARDYLDQAASTVGRVAKDDETQRAAKDAATAVGDALAATFNELRKALGFDDEDQSESGDTGGSDGPSPGNDSGADSDSNGS